MSTSVSIIIPSYNYGHYLPQTIESVLCQGYEPMEIIVVDDGSTDNTREMLEPYISGGRIQYIWQENRGLPGARNTGIRQSRSEYVHFLDADDLLEPGAIKAMAGALDENPACAMAVGGKVFFNEKGEIRREIPPHYQDKDQAFRALVTKDNFISIGCCMIRRQEIEQAGLFREEMRSVEDLDLWLRITYQRPVTCLEKTMARIRKHEKNMSCDAHLPRMFQWEIFAFEKAWQMCDENNDDLSKKMLTDKIRSKKQRLALEYFRTGRISEGREIIDALIAEMGPKPHLLFYRAFPKAFGLAVKAVKLIQRAGRP